VPTESAVATVAEVLDGIGDTCPECPSDFRRDVPAQAIDSKLTAVGKGEQAINVSGHVFRGEVKYIDHVFHKVVTYRRGSTNHLMDQIESFRVGTRIITEKTIFWIHSAMTSLLLSGIAWDSEARPTRKGRNHFQAARQRLSIGRLIWN
jgi:hypothetical protein